MELSNLLNTLPKPGRLEWIGLRTKRRGEMLGVGETEARVGLGLAGDRRAENRPPNPASVRQVTLMQAEHLGAIASFMGLAGVEPAWTRRNLLVSGVNLLALKDKPFRIGGVLLEGSGLCHPCSRMEETLGPGGYNAMRGHGGVTARVLVGGVIRLGDEVRLEGID